MIYTVYYKINIQKAGRHKLINFINYKKSITLDIVYYKMAA